MRQEEESQFAVVDKGDSVETLGIDNHRLEAEDRLISEHTVEMICRRLTFQKRLSALGAGYSFASFAVHYESPENRNAFTSKGLLHHRAIVC